MQEKLSRRVGPWSRFPLVSEKTGYRDWEKLGLDKRQTKIFKSVLSKQPEKFDIKDWSNLGEEYRVKILQAFMDEVRAEILAEDFVIEHGLTEVTK